jgi:hypothetical protein
MTPNEESHVPEPWAVKIAIRVFDYATLSELIATRLVMLVLSFCGLYHIAKRLVSGTQDGSPKNNQKL